MGLSHTYRCIYLKLIFSEADKVTHAFLQLLIAWNYMYIFFYYIF